MPDAVVGVSLEVRETESATAIQGDLFDGEGNMHDDANQADWNNPGTFGMTQGPYSFSPGEHPGILLPDEQMPVRRKP